MPDLQYVLFDAGGTLLGTNTDCEHWYEQFFVDVCAAEGHPVTLEHVRASLQAAVDAYTHDRRCSTPEQVRTFWEHVYSAVFRDLIPGCDPSVMANHYIDRFEQGEFVQLFADTLPALEQLREKGIRAGILSNYGTYLELFLERTGISEFFDVVIISANEGCEKPHPEIFERAKQAVGLPPETVAFVGDNLREDYEASARHGFFPVLIDRYGKYENLPEVRRIRRLGELVQFF